MARLTRYTQQLAASAFPTQIKYYITHIHRTNLQKTQSLPKGWVSSLHYRVVQKNSPLGTKFEIGMRPGRLELLCYKLDL
jgi:hypothetical protein